jgi:DNA excision repair protein ERCC-8
MGRTRSSAFRNKIALLKIQLSLLDNPRVASPHTGEIPALHIDRIEGRFLLCGAKDATVSVYDLSKWGTDCHLQGKPFSAGCNVYKPVARSVRVPFGDEVPTGHSHSVVAVQWYPVDTGAFLSASADGSILIWDTHSMAPVIGWNPLSSISCMHLSTSQGRSDSLLGVGSIDDSFVRLVDIRSGASSHSLVGHEKGINCLEWSPSCDVVVASGSLDGTIRLWDIRKSGSRACVTVLDRDQQFDATQCRPVHASYSHLAKQYKAKVSPNNYRHAESKGMVSHGGSISSLSFCADGSSLVSTGMDGMLQVWDLRGNGHVLPLNFSSQTNHPAVSRTRKKLPMVLQNCGKETIAWVGHGSKVLGYSLQRGGRPTEVLEGHMHVVTSLECVHHSMQLLSAAMDGMILGWGNPPAVSKRRKRKLETENGDRDSW